MKWHAHNHFTIKTVRCIKIGYILIYFNMNCFCHRLEEKGRLQDLTPDWDWMWWKEAEQLWITRRLCLTRHPRGLSLCPGRASSPPTATQTRLRPTTRVPWKRPFSMMTWISSVTVSRHADHSLYIHSHCFHHLYSIHASIFWNCVKNNFKWEKSSERAKKKLQKRMIVSKFEKMIKANPAVIQKV